MAGQGLFRRRTGWFAVLGLVLVPAVAAAWVATEDGPGDGSEPLPPFYLEATMEMDDTSASIGTQIAGSPAPLEAVRRKTQIRWLQYSRDEARVELETVEPAGEAGTDIIVYDGNEQWYYRHETNTYNRGPLQPAPDGITLRVRPWSFGALIGPWYGAATNIEEFMAELREMSNKSTDVRVAGTGMVLGRTVRIVEQSPVSTSSSGSGETRQGVARYWVDEDRMVVLRQEVDDGLAQRFTIEVTTFEWNPKGRGPVEFNPPPGAKQGDEGSLSGTAAPVRQ